MLEFIDSVIQNDAETVHFYLVEQGVDPNLTLDQDGITPLHFAAQNNAYKVILLLITAGTKNYEAIPFNFHGLSKPLSEYLDTVLATVATWYNDDYYLFSFRGARLIHNISPNYTPGLNTKSLELLADGNEKNYRIVMGILHNYQGAPEISDICKNIISALPEKSALLTEVSIIMQSTGVLMGEFSRVHALQQKKESMINWLSDSNPKVQAFARKYIAELDKQIVYQQRRAEEDIELRKHQYGDGAT